MSASIAVSIRLMKKLATLATRFTSPPPHANLSSPAMYACRHLLVGVLREQQRHVDVDAFADQLLNGGNALRRRRNLDHQVVAADCRHNRRASSSVPAVSYASSGETSRLT